eukprot:556658-Pyramimonas_sp.AAC.1
MPWSTDINKHYSQVQEQIIWAAAAAFPVQVVYPRKPCTDQLTLHFVNWRRKNKAVLRTAPDKRAQAMYNWANTLVQPCPTPVFGGGEEAHSLLISFEA